MVLRLVLIEPAKKILAQIGNILSGIVLVVLTLIIGWLVAKLIKFIVVRVLRIARLDEILDQVKLGEFLSKGGIKYSVSELLGVICYWLTLLITLVVAFNTVNLTIATDLLDRIVLYIPNIFSAVVILIFGMFVANFLSTLVQTFANNAGVGQSKLLGKLAEVVTIVFAFIISLEQLRIATTTLVLALNIIIASIGLAIAIAFGIGCRDIAGKYVADLIDRIKSKK